MSPFSPEQDKNLIEALAKIEHAQLTNEMKEVDRVWARKIVVVLRQQKLI